MIRDIDFSLDAVVSMIFDQTDDDSLPCTKEEFLEDYHDIEKAIRGDIDNGWICDSHTLQQKSKQTKQTIQQTTNIYFKQTDNDLWFPSSVVFYERGTRGPVARISLFDRRSKEYQIRRKSFEYNCTHNQQESFKGYDPLAKVELPADFIFDKKRQLCLFPSDVFSLHDISLTLLLNSCYFLSEYHSYRDFVPSYLGLCSLALDITQAEQAHSQKRDAFLCKKQ